MTAARARPTGSLAIIGGTGLNSLPGLIDGPTPVPAQTPWGPAAAAVRSARWGERSVLFLPRHGPGHVLPPHRINYRANLWALREAGAGAVIAVAATGGISPVCAPGALVVPDQLIDYTNGREHTYFDGSDGVVTHIDFTWPYDAGLRERLLRQAEQLGETVVPEGVYGCTNGPRLESAAEVHRLARDGCTLVGMTGMPEAALARELGLPYACLAVVVNSAAGLGESSQAVVVASFERVLEQAMRRVIRLLVGVATDWSAAVDEGPRG